MHAEALEVGKGADGIRDAGMLESAVYAPINSYVDTLAEIAATYAHGIALAHAFVDGNKRTAVYAMLSFLEANGLELTLPTEHWTDLIEAVAEGTLTRDQLAEEIATELGRRNGNGPPLWGYIEEDEL